MVLIKPAMLEITLWDRPVFDFTQYNMLFFSARGFADVQVVRDDPNVRFGAYLFLFNLDGNIHCLQELSNTLKYDAKRLHWHCPIATKLSSSVNIFNFRGILAIFL